ncbi:hypothetical protein HWQ46_14705 [Shewanella sp. D64]|uniref:DarT1-associated NADAR antitoxin family protein n=1 Tax=unclassified Shewanella TaxID=196818 RepID=UPI0022BA11E9|nr:MULTISPECIES: hypothetical protein [unclassified Shewanella]MEC4726802.1 hypothetical protein [Shewanella sp. D64]MEC4739086.1 hypothetical protein [Shewanella sp. E94]WBJ95942.1 hypothetical protein HWQ47_02050 [Shewanella sp. MTB7]
MASRPVFRPSDDYPYVTEDLIEFKWHSGFAATQKQKSVEELHTRIIETNLAVNPLEVSSKSSLGIGVSLSAFNLMVKLANGKDVAVENIFQAAKIFQSGGPYKDLLQVSPLDAKRDIRLKESGSLIGFQGKEGIWPLEPKTLFYDWIYLNALNRNPSLTDAIKKFDSFTDIEFNPSKSFNCQARSLALYVSLSKAGKIESLLNNSKKYQDLFLSGLDNKDKLPAQQSLI